MRWLVLSCALTLAVIERSRALTVSNEVKFVIPQFGSKCFQETLPVDKEVKCEVFISDGPGDLLIDIFITRMMGGTVIQSRKKVSHEAFSFKTPHPRNPSDTTEKFRFCFLHQGRSDSYNEARKIIFKYRAGVAAVDPSVKEQFAKKDSLEKVEEVLEHAADLFDEVTEELEFMMQLESDLFHETARTSRTVLVYSLFSCVVLILTGGYRYYVATKFFKQMKVI
eukprot:Plantae.Rhodophyta-Purpureofilum_apyrenoidigerum.ctg382.p1 GENE.Plantae.Rhodophyta-Purpureofilum_apyrenoidigerum.ctg382~~Plantae.Rhodophyta-Purpureofilum_apyrenoidigerum.ctg382.p1  ORF type:complete len:224 (+),score=48.58 Plantae.Rhodophyta-Purpureofilum_apyrenoidigerum.ctg382:177-848(+)